MLSHWFKHYYNIQCLGIAGFAFALNFSISITQSFLGASLFLWLVQLYLVRKFKERDEVKQFQFDQEKLESLKTLIVLFLIWIGWRLIHVATSDQPLKELIEAREVWLLAIVPWIVKNLHGVKRFYIVLVALIAGSLIPSFGTVTLAMEGTELKRWPIFKEIHHLTYAGTLGLTFFIVSGFVFYLYQRSKKIAATGALAVAILILGGFALGHSKGAYIAIFICFTLMLILILRKWFFVALPLLLFLPVYLYNNVPLIKAQMDFAFVGWEHLGYSSWSVRLDLWKAGFKMFLEKPFFGFGDADYGVMYHQYKMPGAKEIAMSGSHMHNDYMQTLVAYGSIGLSIWLTFFAYPLKHFFQAYFNAVKSIDRIYLVFLISPVILMLFMMLSQCHFTDEEVQMTFWLAVSLYFWNINHSKAEYKDE